MKKILFAGSVLLGASTAADTCHALVMSGGANKGAYEAGVISGLVSHLTPSEVTWDVVSGVSAGAMNTAGVCTHAVGDEVNMVDYLLNMWGNLTSDKIYVAWPGGFLQGLTLESGLYDDTPLRTLIANVLNEKGIHRRVVVSAVDSNTGKYSPYTEAVGVAEFAKVVVASGSVPFVFPDM